MLDSFVSFALTETCLRELNRDWELKYCSCLLLQTKRISQLSGVTNIAFWIHPNDGQAV